MASPWRSALLASGALVGHTNSVAALAVLPDGRAASASDDNTVRRWEIASGRQLALFVADGAIGPIEAIGNDMIAAGDATGAVHFLEFHV